MKFFNWKNFKKSLLSSFVIFAFSPSVMSEAVSVTNIYLGKNSAYVDSDVPPAIKLNAAYDGLAAGTYLYRVYWQDIAYYTPVTPKRYQDTSYEPQENKQYRNWGPWNMGKNKTQMDEIKSNKKYYNKVKIPSGTMVQGPSSTNVNSSINIGRLSSSIEVYVRAYTKFNSSGPFVYFSLVGTQFEGANSQNIGRVLASSIQTNETPTTVFRSGSYLKERFSYLGKYADTTDSSHRYLEKGKWKNSSSAPDGLANQYGEWCYIGYNSKGEPLSNPYFPSTELHFLGSSEIKYYDWRTNPFSTKSTFDGDAYLSARKELIERLLDNGTLTYTGNKQTAITNWTKKFTFLTHPTKDTAILMGMRTANEHTRDFAVVNPPGDLYLSSLEVYDGSTKVASYTYNISTGARTRSNGRDIIPGKTYTVKVKIGNGSNRAILASKNEALVGITKESKFLDLETLSSRQLSNIQSRGDTKSIGSNKGNTSDYITFNVTAPTNTQVFDIYGMVGESHDGTDNMENTNDSGFVRMYTTLAPSVEVQITTGSANLKATSIELLDASNNSVVYSSAGGVTKTAIIPGKSYKIRYNIKNTGGRPTVTTTRPGSEAADGTWTPATQSVSYPTVKIPISYTNTLKVNNSSGSLADVSSNGTNKKITVNGSEDISLTAGGTYTYTTEAIYFANPYLDSTFTINVAQGIGNSDTTDDTTSASVADLYDAVISDVQIHPAYEYVSNGNRHTAYNVVYSAKIDAASHIKNVGNISNLVKTRVTIGNRTVDFEDVLVAKDGYQKFSHVIEDVLLRNDTVGVRATVNLNFDRKTYETNYDNNSGESSSSVVKAIANPFNGSNDDKVSHVDTSNGSSISGGGVLNNNCLIPRRSNSWNVVHRKHTWTSSTNNYSIGNSSYSANVYTTLSDSTENKSYTESFNIKSIQFKSKETEGKGDNGWVDLLVSNQSDLAKIKAGYGFELKVVTEYRTNATKTQPNPSNNTSYTGIIGDNGISYSNEIFVELPGTEGVHGTRKILSTTGYSGTTNGLLISERDLSTSSEVVKEFTYTIKPSNTLGISEVGKIFVPTGLKDGKYKISIYTPPISGAISNGKNKYTSLCDRRDVYINVSGSYTDDLNSNIIQ